MIEAATDEDKDIQIICFTETWITTVKRDLLRIEGYDLASCFCRSNREGGGVCIFLRNDIGFKERKDILKMNIEYIFETCAIELPKHNLLLITIYWPDKNREPETFNNALTKLLKHLSIKDKTKNIILGGDLNINILEQNDLALNLLNLMRSYNFKTLVTEPTRITQSSSTCIDLVFSNIYDADNKAIATVKDYGLSDHMGVYVSVPHSENSQSSPNWYANERVFSEKNIKIFKQKICKIKWTSILKSEESINNNYNLFHSKITSILEQALPITKIKIKRKKYNTWLTKGLRISCKNKRLLKIFIAQTDSTILHNHYKNYEKKLKKSIAIAKKIQYKKFVMTSNNVIKAMWQVVKERTNKNAQKTKKNMHIFVENKHIEDPCLIANYFNNYFSTLGAPNQGSKSGRQLTAQRNNSIFINPTDRAEVLYLIKKIKNKKSYGFDELPPTLIKECAAELAEPLSFLINQSFAEGIVPDLLKIALVKPLHKKDSRADPNNYRPIALLPTFSKIFESAMNNRIYSFCEKYNILSDSQNGFRKQRSTTSAVVKYVTEILRILSNKKHAIGVFLDMSKAYDRVLHNILLSKLSSIGIRGVAHKWLTSYLNNRTQYVEIEHIDTATGQVSKKRSDRVITNQSIPQGSVIGSLLFLIYINELPKIIDIPCNLFADDISLIFSCENEAQLEHTLDSNLSEIESWLEDHNLKINCSKTNLMQFRPYQKNPLNIDYNYKNTKLSVVDSHCFLGITLDSNINWKSHIQKIINKLSSFIYALYELKKTTDTNTAICAYHAYAQSWLQYGVMLWGNSTETDRLFILQKKCIRILANIDARTSCRKYFVKFNILTLASLYVTELCTYVKNNSEMFPPHTRPENLRPKNRLAIQTSHLKMFNTGPHPMAAKIYNELPNHLKNMKKINLFKSALKEYLVTKCYYSIEEYLNDANKE